MIDACIALQSVCNELTRVISWSALPNLISNSPIWMIGWFIKNFEAKQDYMYVWKWESGVQRAYGYETEQH